MNSKWNSSTLEEMKKDVPRSTAMGPFGSKIKKENYRSVGVPVIRGSNLTAERFVDDGYAFVSEQKAEELSSSFAWPEDIVFVAQGTIGRVGIIPRNAHFEKYILSQNLMKVTCDTNKFDPLYVFYYFRSHGGQNEILSYANSTGVPCISRPLTSLRSFRVLHPPLLEQRAIAHILGTLDDKIELNRRMNETLEEMARAIFKSWFVDFDPVRAKAEGRDPGLPKHIADLFPDRFEDSELGEIPAGWNVAALSEGMEVNPRRSLKKGDVAPYLDMKNMPTRSARALHVYDREFGSGVRFTDGDTLVARITPCLENGKTCFVDFLGEGNIGWGSTEYIVMRPKLPLTAEFAYFLARTEKFRTYAVSSMTGTSGRQRVPAASFDQFAFAIPSAEIAEQFGTVARTILSNMKVRDEESSTLAAIRDALLPRLISGELRVSDANRFIEVGL